MESKLNSLLYRTSPSFRRPTFQRPDISSRPISNSEVRTLSDELSTERSAPVRTKRLRPICPCPPHQHMRLPGLTDLKLRRHQEIKWSPGPRDQLGQADPDWYSPRIGPRARGPKGQLLASNLPPIQLKAKDQEGEVEPGGERQEKHS